MKRKAITLNESACGSLPLGAGTFWILLDEATVGAKHFSLLLHEIVPGMGGGSHSHDVEQCFYILSGRGIFTIGENRYEAGPETAIYVPAGVSHHAEGLGTTPLRYLTVYAPSGPEHEYWQFVER